MWPFKRHPSVSVLCATFRPSGLAIPIACLKRQALKPDQIVFVADGIDFRAAMGGYTSVTGIANRLDWITISRSPNLYGNCIPLNAGLDIVKGDVTMVLTDLATISDKWIEGHLALLTKNTCLVSGGTEVGGRWFPFGEGATLKSSATASAVYGASLSIRTVLLRKIGGWDERFNGGHGYDDFLLAHRAVAHSGLECTVSTDPRVVAHRPPHDDGDKVIIRTVEENKALFEALRSDQKELLKPAWRSLR